MKATTALTYVKYAIGECQRVRNFPTFKALSKSAAAANRLRESPNCFPLDTVIWFLENFVHNKAYDLTQRMGFWLQQASGGRPHDVSELAQKDVHFDNSSVAGIVWHITKTANAPSDRKSVQYPLELRNFFGPPPMSPSEWKALDEERPMKDYSSTSISNVLKSLKVFDDVPNSTCIRNMFHECILYLTCVTMTWIEPTHTPFTLMAAPL